MGKKVWGAIFKHLPRRDNKNLEPSYLEITRHRDKGAIYYDTYKWIGSKYGTATISVYLWSKGARYSMPWPVKIVAHLPFDDTYEIVRKDVGLGIWWRLVYVHRKLSLNKRWLHIKWRIIKTFEVWGFGYTQEGEEVRWKNIRRSHAKSKVETKRNS